MERITQIINDWDPIGFFPMAPKDEYINEIKNLLVSPNFKFGQAEERSSKL